MVHERYKSLLDPLVERGCIRNVEVPYANGLGARNRISGHILTVSGHGSRRKARLILSMRVECYVEQ